MTWTRFRGKANVPGVTGVRLSPRFAFVREQPVCRLAACAERGIVSHVKGEDHPAVTHAVQVREYEESPVAIAYRLFGDHAYFSETDRDARFFQMSRQGIARFPWPEMNGGRGRSRTSIQAHSYPKSSADRNLKCRITLSPSFVPMAVADRLSESIIAAIGRNQQLEFDNKDQRIVYLVAMELLTSDNNR